MTSDNQNEPTDPSTAQHIDPAAGPTDGGTPSGQRRRLTIAAAAAAAIAILGLTFGAGFWAGTEHNDEQDTGHSHVQEKEHGDDQDDESDDASESPESAGPEHNEPADSNEPTTETPAPSVSVQAPAPSAPGHAPAPSTAGPARP
ncbi:MAG: hypothetical protein U0R77_13640 [Mycolicibacterium insubricum]|nr:hypothetical protein [Mycobacterium sp.]